MICLICVHVHISFKSFKLFSAQRWKFDFVFLAGNSFVDMWSVTCHIYSKVLLGSLAFSESVISVVKSSVWNEFFSNVELWSVVSLMGWGTWSLFVMMFMFWERVSWWWQTFLLSRIMRTENSLLLPSFPRVFIRDAFALTLKVQFTRKWTFSVIFNSPSCHFNPA